jgi:hypothetical protein
MRVIREICSDLKVRIGFDWRGLTHRNTSHRIILKKQKSTKTCFEPNSGD